LGKPNTFAYEFHTTNSKGECVQICDPRLTDDESLQGTAVIFKGDVYDGFHFTVNDPDDSQKDLVNFACYGSLVSKMHFLRYTAMNNQNKQDRQAMLNLLTANYCPADSPDGQPRFNPQLASTLGFSADDSWFTKEGHAIRLGFLGHVLDVSAVNQSPLGLQPPASVEALWNDQGATCIDTPRLVDPMSPASAQKFIASIKQQCPAIKECKGVLPMSPFVTPGMSSCVLSNQSASCLISGTPLKPLVIE
jgi:hypothetical protein